MLFNFHVNIIISVILGVLAGIFFPAYNDTYFLVGNLFIKLLKYIVVPLVFTSLVTSIIGLKNLGALQKMSIRTIFYFFVTSLLSASIGVLVALLLQPGGSVNDHHISDSIVTSAFSFKLLISQLIPSSFESFITGSYMLFLIIISVITGICVKLLDNKFKFPLDELFDGFNEFMIIITRWIINITPIGIFGLIAELVISTGIDIIFPLLNFMGVVTLGLMVHACIILPLILNCFIKCSSIQIAKDIFSSLTTGFSTASSSATLPILIDEVRKKLKIPNKVASFVLPLGTTLHMDGTALFQSAATIFIAQYYNINLTISTLMIIIAMSLLASISAAAIPSGGILTLAIILTAINIPLEGIALIIGIDRLLDMLRTTVNIWGNAIASIVITTFQKEAAYE